MAMATSPKLQIESMQTVMSIKQTERRSRLISIAEDHAMDIFRRRLHVVLYYKKASEEESGWLLVGWMRESLATALVEQPMFGGRLRGVENGGGREFEIVSNDCGVRLFEARIMIKLSEFLDMKERREADARLVFWEDIDEQNPLFSPLCYVQVTNFECGGYSIGFSCSLLVADPLAMTSFLKNWVKIHNTITSKPNIPKTPLFYLPILRKPGGSVPNIKCSMPSINIGQTVIFKVPSSKILCFDRESKRAIAAICIEKAEQKFGSKMAEKVTFIMKESSEEIRVETFTREGVGRKDFSMLNGLSSVSWDDLETDELSLHNGNKPACVSHWMYSISDEGLLMVFPSPDEGKSGMNIVITIPNEKMT